MAKGTRPVGGGALSLVAGVALTVAGCALAVKRDSRGIDEMIAAATTATDQQMIAARYEDESASARAKAAMHKRMAVSYRNFSGRGIATAQMDTHCESLARIYEEAAKENDALAQSHREMAR